MTEVFLGLGSNLGNRKEQLERACAEIELRVGPVVLRSDFIETEPWGYDSPHPFLNAVVRCHTRLSPLQLLDTTQLIEWLLGKRDCHATQRSLQASVPTRYHDRPVDIDILFYGLSVIDLPRLRVPHPLMLQREFVMTPLRQVLSMPADGRYLALLGEEAAR